MSNEAGYIPPSLPANELRKLLLEALENVPGKDFETYHARFDHLERGLTVDDVIHGIEGSWTFQRPPKFNKTAWQWKYRLAAKTIDYEDMVIVVAVDSLKRTFEVITRWTHEETD
jgi:hypothetical protein